MGAVAMRRATRAEADAGIDVFLQVIDVAVDHQHLQMHLRIAFLFAGHMIPWDQLEVFTRSVQRFLAS